MAFSDAIISPSITSADIMQAVQDGLTAQGYTAAKAIYLDAAISSIPTVAEIEASTVLAKASSVATVQSNITDLQLSVAAIPTTPLLAADYDPVDYNAVTAAIDNEAIATAVWNYTE